MERASPRKLNRAHCNRSGTEDRGHLVLRNGCTPSYTTSHRHSPTPTPPLAPECVPETSSLHPGDRGAAFWQFPSQSMQEVLKQLPGVGRPLAFKDTVTEGSALGRRKEPAATRRGWPVSFPRPRHAPHSCRPVASNTRCSHLGPEVLEVRAWPEEGKRESAPWSAPATLMVVGSPWKAQP